MIHRISCYANRLVRVSRSKDDAATDGHNQRPGMCRKAMRLHYLVSGLIIVSGAALLGTTVAAQSTKSLALEDAERIAIQNHPQIQAAREMAVAAGLQKKDLRIQMEL